MFEVYGTSFDNLADCKYKHRTLKFILNRLSCILGVSFLYICNMSSVFMSYFIATCSTLFLVTCNFLSHVCTANFISSSLTARNVLHLYPRWKQCCYTQYIATSRLLSGEMLRFVIWIKVDQLDDTCFIVYCSTCFRR